MSGPARAVAIKVAAKEDRFEAPTAVMEKLYGGAEKICESVIEISTSHEMHVVNSRVAQATIGEPRKKNGRMRVRQNDVLSQYPLYGRSSRTNDFFGSLLDPVVGLEVVFSSVCSKSDFLSSTWL